MKNILILTLTNFLFISLGFTQIQVFQDGKTGVGPGFLNGTFSAADEQLHVDGDVVAIQGLLQNTSKDASWTMNRTDKSAFAIGAGVNAGFAFDKDYDFRIYTNTRGQIEKGIIQGAGSQNQMVIKGNGNIGMGAINPSEKLQVNGNIKYTGSLVTSDKRLKYDVKNFKYGLDEVLNLNPIIYKYNGKGGTIKGDKHVGLYAQELQDLVPDLIKEYTHKEYEGEDTKIVKSSDIYLSVKDNEIKYLLINAIKEQQELINSLVDRITDLENNSTDQNQGIDNIQDVIIENKDRAELLQNVPNPFSSNTNIGYYVPREFNEAQISIFNLNGSLIKEIPITDYGKGKINVETIGITAGTYTYQLSINNKIVGAKRMVIVD